ncbi:MAG: flippase-like domain-containing protein [Candidatus Thorarchaeota archaeon]|nr:flippase-like domain-containing protein [Candidatus Thorarchaeota archaeon]
MTENEVTEELVEEAQTIVSIKKLVLFVFVGVIVYLLVGLYGKFDQVAAAVLSIPWYWVIPVMMGLSFLNYIIRFGKWQYYLRKIGVHLSHVDSFNVFLAGFTLTATPGKVGEAVKGVFIYEIDKTPLAKTVPVVISERVTDLLAMVILSVFAFLIGFSGGDQLLLLLLVGGATLVGAIILGRSAFYQKIVKKMTSFGFLKRFQDSCDVIEGTMVTTLSPRPMALATAISVPGWFMECLEMWLLLSLFTGAGLPSLTPASLMLLAQATFIHAGASTVGALLVFLPGGLGGYEPFAIYVMTIMLGLTASIAGAATILIRFVTLWFSVIVGFISAAIISHRAKRRQSAT